MIKVSAQEQKPDSRVSADFQIRQLTIPEWSRLSWENFTPDTTNSTFSITWLGVFDMSSFEIILELSKELWRFARYTHCIRWNFIYAIPQYILTSLNLVSSTYVASERRIRIFS